MVYFAFVDWGNYEVDPFHRATGEDEIRTQNRRLATRVTVVFVQPCKQGNLGKSQILETRRDPRVTKFTNFLMTGDNI